MEETPQYSRIIKLFTFDVASPPLLHDMLMPVGASGPSSAKKGYQPQKCGKCKNHGADVLRRGHAASCPYKHCDCAKCTAVSTERPVSFADSGGGAAASQEPKEDMEMVELPSLDPMTRVEKLGREVVAYGTTMYTDFERWHAFMKAKWRNMDIARKKRKQEGWGQEQALRYAKKNFIDAGKELLESAKFCFGETALF